MRVAVLSDTHGRLGPVRLLRGRLGAVDFLLHAGDFHADARACAAIFGLPPDRVAAVVGNCDFPDQEPAEQVLELEGVRIVLVHGHRHDAKKGPLRVYLRARELGCRVAVFGHSHVPLLEEHEGVLLLNPGSPSFPRLPGKPGSCAVLELGPDGPAARHVWLDGSRSL
ncbi:metallophosphoesterase [Caldinitratiruptor microaerophilus]|uniref:Phosphoesterase n=1 Tax=Caldinitratiruptor microaerophilus TaxID=671077 RepID=A0AA35CNA5_9FIRM|nr:metallophosphoesterase [Caldinitratiruptor microaerophilus]BDG61538.1 putative metallophosphoesterase YsnB [Caldinitratiruptor microaerophilus]